MNAHCAVWSPAGRHVVSLRRLCSRSKRVSVPKIRARPDASSRAGSIESNASPLIQHAENLAQHWSQLVQRGRDVVTALPPTSVRAGLLGLGAGVVLTFLLALARSLFAIFLRRPTAASAAPYSKPPPVHGRERSPDDSPGKDVRTSYAYTSDSIHAPAQESAISTDITEMAQVMQHAGQKVAVMQQVVDAAKARLKLEKEHSGTLEEEAETLKKQIACLETDKEQFKKRTTALQDRIDVMEKELKHALRAAASKDSTPHLTSTAGTDAQVSLKQKEALEKLLVAAQSAKEQMASIMKTSEERAVELQLQLDNAQLQIKASDEANGKLSDKLETAQADKEELLMTVEKLTSAQARSLDESAQRDESVRQLQKQVDLMKQQLASSSEALQALEEGGQKSATRTEGKINVLQEELDQLQAEKAAAEARSERVSLELHEYEEEIAEAVASALHVSLTGMSISELRRTAESTEESAIDEASAGWWGLPNAQIQERLKRQSVRLQEARLQLNAITSKMEPANQQEAVRLRKLVDDVTLLRKGLKNMRIASERRQRDLELAAEQENRTVELLAHAKLSMSAGHFSTYKALCKECDELERSCNELQSAMELSLKERLISLLAQQSTKLWKIVMSEVEKEEAASLARIRAEDTRAHAAAQRVEAEAQSKLQQRLQQIQEQQRARDNELSERQRTVALQESELQRQVEELQIASAEASQRELDLQELAKEYSGAYAVQQKEEALQTMQAQLNEDSGKIRKAEAAVEAMLEDATAQSQSAAVELKRAQSTAEAVALQQNRLDEQEALLTSKLEQADSEIAARRAAADRDIEEMKRQALDEVANLKKEPDGAVADSGSDSEAAQLRSQVASLQEELAGLKDSYSRKFIASKQELDAAEARMRQLRRQLAEKGGSMPRAHNGVGPHPLSGSTRSSPPGAGGAAQRAGAGSPHNDDGSGGEVTGETSDFSAWASQLITRVSRSPQSGLETAGQGLHSSAGKRSPRAMAGTSTLERPAVAAPAAPSVAAPDTEQVQLNAVGFCIPHPAKKDKGGEDAHFVVGTSAIGVADGVGGWIKSGINPGEYSAQLMRYTAEAIQRDAGTTCVAALEYAHDQVNVPGSSTAIVARLVDKARLEVANLGDSGLRVIREGRVAYATDVLQHSFNMPFQLGNKTLIPYTDVPDKSLQAVVQLQLGDVVVMASDGFFDNVWDEDLARLVKNSCLMDGSDESNCLEMMAERLAQVAATNAQDKMFRSPWSVECAKHNDVGLLRKLFPRGGKVDDITVVVARVE